MIEKKIKKILISPRKISSKVKELAGRINRDYRGKDLVLIVILKGALFFASDLLKFLEIPLIVDFISISSYGDSTETSGEVKLTKDLEENISGKNCLIVEDIIDTGLTLSYLIRILKLRKPKSLKVCTFLNKKERRIRDSKLDYEGFIVPNEFLVGYGLDYKEDYRHYPYVFTLKRSFYDSCLAAL